MNEFLFKAERKYGQYAIRNLSLIIVLLYCTGFVLELFSSIGGVNIDILGYLSLNPYLILHGQVWRLVSWLLIPPDSFSPFIILVLYFYFSIGRSLEQVWGDFRYNIYFFSGILFTIIGAFIVYGLAFLIYDEELTSGIITAEELFTYVSIKDVVNMKYLILPGAWFRSISTYYLSISILLAYAMTLPEERILLMFFIPIRAKMLGIFYAVLIAFEVIEQIIVGNYCMVIIIVVSMLNAIIFFLLTKHYYSRNKIKSTYKRRADFTRKIRVAKVNMGQEAVHEGKTVFTRHKCAICGATELDGENIEFRFCSKCDGNYEYCSNHLYTHEHVKKI